MEIIREEKLLKIIGRWVPLQNVPGDSHKVKEATEMFTYIKDHVSSQVKVSDLS